MSLVTTPADETADSEGAIDDMQNALDGAKGPEHLKATAASLVDLPWPALCLIVYHSDIKQKLRLAMTCRTLHRIVSKDTAAWPAEVYIALGSTSDLHEFVEESAILACNPERKHRKAAGQQFPYGSGILMFAPATPPATDLERMLTCMQLPAVCPVPVQLWISPSVRKDGPLNHFLTQYVLPWLERRKADNSLPFLNVYLDSILAESRTTSQLLNVWRDTTVPVELLTNVIPGLPEDYEPLANVWRLALYCGGNIPDSLYRTLRLFPHATTVQVDIISLDELWKHLPTIWTTFAQSRAEPTLPHTLRLLINSHWERLLLAAIKKTQSGVPSRLREVMKGNIELESIEELAEVKGVAVHGNNGYEIDSYLAISQPVLTLHLQMKHHPQAEWTIEISKDVEFK